MNDREEVHARVQGAVALPGGSELVVPVVETTRWGELWAPSSLSELLALTAAMHWTHAWLDGWRGQADISWRLDSGAVRRLLRHRPSLARSPEGMEEAVHMYEARLLNNARLAGHGHAGGRRLSDLELMALLQHHGAATRLLDFTENVLVATWFACQAHEDRHGILVAVNLSDGWQLRDEAEIQLPFEQLIKKAERRLIWWKPEALSRRIPAQAAFHVWGLVTFRDWGSLASGAADLPDVYEDVSVINDEMSAIAIPAQAQREPASTLRPLFGFGAASLFPDIDGFATFNAASQELGEDYFEI